MRVTLIVSVRALAAASMCLAMSATASCDIACNRGPDGVSLFPGPDALWVGDSVHLAAKGYSINEFCQPTFAGSDQAPSQYTFKMNDTTVARFNSTRDLVALSVGYATVAVQHKRGGNDAKATWSIAKPVAQLRFTVTPAAPAVGDTVTVMTEALDSAGVVASGAVFSGIYMVAEYRPEYSGPIRLTYGSDRGRWILRAPGKYTFKNGVMRLGNRVVAGEYAVIIP